MNHSEKIVVCEEIHLVPDKEATIRCKLGKAPWKVQNAQIIAKVQVTNKQQYHTLRVKVQDDQIVLKFINTTPSSIRIKQGQILGCVDLRSVGVYMIEQDQLLHLHERDITFMSKEEMQEILMESMESWMKVFDKNEDEIDPDDPYCWLSDSDIRKKMTDNEILDKFVNLDKSILTEEEKKDFQKILYKHKKAFSLRDEIGTCKQFSGIIGHQ